MILIVYSDRLPGAKHRERCRIGCVDIRRRYRGGLPCQSTLLDGACTVLNDLEMGIKDESVETCCVEHI